MEIEIKVKKTIEVKYLQIEAKPRYWEDTNINGAEDTEGDLIPCRSGDLWCPIIELETGKVINWENGKEAFVHFKVCDGGEYFLLDENKEKVIKYKDYYVPDILAIEDDGYGDYIIMNIDTDGIIKDWNFESSGFTKAV